MTHERDPFIYHAAHDRVVDGDTFDFVFDLGFGIHIAQRVRLQGVDTAEIYGVKRDSDEYQRGREHEDFVSRWLDAAIADWDGPWPLFVDTQGTTGKYGRWTADVQRRSDGANLAHALISEFPEVADA